MISNIFPELGCHVGLISDRRCRSWIYHLQFVTLQDLHRKVHAAQAIAIIIWNDNKLQIHAQQPMKGDKACIIKLKTNPSYLKYNRSVFNNVSQRTTEHTVDV